MKKNEPAEPALLVLQSTQRTTNQIVNAAKVYANIRWRFDTKLRETLAGANYLKEPTVHQSGARQALGSETQPTLLTSSAITTGHWSTNLACSSLSSLNPGHTLDILVPTRFLSPIGRSILILLHGPCRRKGHHRRAIVVTTRLDVHHGRSKITGSRVSSPYALHIVLLSRDKGL